MRKFVLLSASILLATSCTQNKLDKEKAFRLIETSYPKTAVYAVRTADPNLVAALTNPEAEATGLITVREPLSLGDLGSTLISFTPKAESYLLPRSAADSSASIQCVRVANEELKEVLSVESVSDEEVVAEYRTVYTNQTPFARLLPVNVKEARKYRAVFSLKKDGWHIEKTTISDTK